MKRKTTIDVPVTTRPPFAGCFLSSAIIGQSMEDAKEILSRTYKPERFIVIYTNAMHESKMWGKQFWFWIAHNGSIPKDWKAQ